MKIIYANNNKIFNKNYENIPFLSFDMLDKLGFPNAYTSRYSSYDETTGEGSTGLRLARMKTETREECLPIIRGNMEILAESLGTSLDKSCITNQKHTNHVLAVKEEDLGFGRQDLHLQNIDGLVTDVPKAMLVAYGGDCPPVYIVDPTKNVIGLVHAGWKGTLSKIPEVAIATMHVKYGCDPKDMYAAIGPSICEDCYEMGDEIYEEFCLSWGQENTDSLMKRHPAMDKDGNEIKGGKYHLDLWEANKMTLINAGIPEEHIEVTNVCTMCNSDIFYSYRAGKMENEQQAILVNRRKDSF